VRWAYLQLAGVKFAQDVEHEKVSKLVDFYRVIKNADTVMATLCRSNTS